MILNNVGRSEVAVGIEEALATLQVEQLATILPHSTKLMSWAQDGTLHEFCDDEVDTMMVPLLEYIETSEVWPEEELMERWYQLHPAEATANEAVTVEPLVDRIVEGERVEVETVEVNHDSVSAHSDVATQNQSVNNGAKIGAVPAVSDIVDEVSDEDSAVEAKSTVEAAVTETSAPVASSAKSAVEAAIDAAKDTTEKVAATVKETVETATDKAEAVAEEVADTAATMAESAAEKAEAAADTVSDKAEDIVENVTDAAETAAEKKQDAVEAVAEAKEEEPAQPKKMGLFETIKKRISSLWS